MQLGPLSWRSNCLSSSRPSCDCAARQFTGLSHVKTLLMLLACVAEGAIVGAMIGGLLGHWRKRRSALAHERERVRQRYVALLNLGLNTPLSLRSSTRSKVYRYARATRLATDTPRRAVSGASLQRGGPSQNSSPTLTNAKEPQLRGTDTINLIPTIPTEQRREAIGALRISVAIVVPSAIIC